MGLVAPSRAGDAEEADVRSRSSGGGGEGGAAFKEGGEEAFVFQATGSGVSQVPQDIGGPVCWGGEGFNLRLATSLKK